MCISKMCPWQKYAKELGGGQVGYRSTCASSLGVSGCSLDQDAGHRNIEGDTFKNI